MFKNWKRIALTAITFLGIAAGVVLKFAAPGPVSAVAAVVQEAAPIAHDAVEAIPEDSADAGD